MELIVNGEARRAKAETIRALLNELEFEGGFFAVAVNRTVVPRRAWDETLLREGDKIEIVSPRQGG